MQSIISTLSHYKFECNTFLNFLINVPPFFEPKLHPPFKNI